jgi:hypothetical protein
MIPRIVITLDKWQQQRACKGIEKIELFPLVRIGILRKFRKFDPSRIAASENSENARAWMLLTILNIRLCARIGYSKKSIKSAAKSFHARVGASTNSTNSASILFFTPLKTLKTRACIPFLLPQKTQNTRARARVGYVRKLRKFPF